MGWCNSFREEKENKKFKNFSFYNKCAFRKRYNRLIKRKTKAKNLKNKKTEEKKMREVSKEEMREVTAGKWQCNTCGRKFSLWIKLWSWAAHGCVGFKYHWVFF